MKTIQVLGSQSLFDIAIQYTGDIKNVFAIAMKNNKSVTDQLITGESIVIPDLEVLNKELKYLNDRNILPATALAISDFVENTGIGYMKIETTFKVN